MHSAQLQIVIGTLMLLATIQLAINNSILSAYVESYDSDATIEATALAHSMMDEVMSKSYDQSTVAAKQYSTDALTMASNFGPDGATEKISGQDAEPFLSKAKFNDVDDYHRYQRNVASDHLGNFLVTDSVCYVQQSNPDLISSGRTPSRRRTARRRFCKTLK